jgi:multiple sugar transport system substrate-binding protein
MGGNAMKLKAYSEKTRKLITLGIVLVLIFLTACANNSNEKSGNPSESGSSQPSGNKITLDFWNGFTGPDGELLTKIVERYNQTNNANVQIKMDIMPWDQMYQKLPPAIATQTAPDLVLMAPVSSVSYIQNDTLRPLNDFFEVSGADKTDFSDSSLTLSSADGNNYLLPMQMNGLYLYWNKDMFKAAGLDPETPPATLDQLAEFAVKLSNPGKNQYGVGFPVKAAPYYFTSLIEANGGAVVDAAAKKSVFDSPENIKTFEWLQQLAKQKATPAGATGGDLDKLLISGQLGMYISGPWMISGLKSNNINFGVAIPPKGTVRQAMDVGGVGFAVPSSTPDEHIAGIYDFIKYWNSTEIGKEWSISNGFPPYLKSVAQDPDVQKDPVISVMANMDESGVGFLPGYVTAERIAAEIFLAIESVVSGNSDPADILQRASEKIDSILKDEP